MVCDERPMGSKIILDAPDGNSLWNLILVHVEIVLVLVHDRYTVCAKHTIGSEIVLDASDGTPRLRGLSRCAFRSI
jgi:hypothetical protein